VSAADQAWAVLPVKPFDWAKSRLDGVLTPAERAALARQLMTGSLAALVDSGCFQQVVVVSRDAEALAMAEQRGAVAVTEEAPADLNQAIVTVRDLALAESASCLLVVASDLPLVRPDDIRRVMAAGESADAVIVPDRRAEGTNALLMRPPNLIDPAFGLQSFPRHMSLLAAASARVSVLRLEAIAFDVDVPQDLTDLEVRGLA